MVNHQKVAPMITAQTSRLKALENQQRASPDLDPRVRSFAAYLVTSSQPSFPVDTASS